jgi:hypothetical protein
MLRLNLGVPVSANPSRLGVLGGDLQGFPNGRRLTDDVVDIELQALEGAAQTGKIVPALAKGDAVDSNDDAFGSAFPYVALPNVGAVNKGGGTGAAPTVNHAVGPAPRNSAAPAERPTTTAAARESGSNAAAMVAGVSGVGAVAVVLLGGAWLLRRRRPAPARGPDTPDN